MSIKTNKSYSKRLKITRTGKILARKGGQNHFNAKESRAKQLSNKRQVNFIIKTKAASHLLPNQL